MTVIIIIIIEFVFIPNSGLYVFVFLPLVNIYDKFFLTLMSLVLLPVIWSDATVWFGLVFLLDCIHSKLVKSKLNVSKTKIELQFTVEHLFLYTDGIEEAIRVRYFHKACSVFLFRNTLFITGWVKTINVRMKLQFVVVFLILEPRFARFSQWATHQDDNVWIIRTICWSDTRKKPNHRRSNFFCCCCLHLKQTMWSCLQEHFTKNWFFLT